MISPLFALFELHTRPVWLFWTKTEYVFSGTFNSNDDACSFAHNILGHATSATFRVTPITRGDETRFINALLGSTSS